MESLTRSRQAEEEKAARVQDIKQLAANKAFAKAVEKEHIK